MLLALDIGNSAVKGGLFDGDALATVFSLSVDGKPATAADWTDRLAPHLADHDVAQVGLVSVVPATTTAVTEALASLTPAPVTTIHPGLTLPFTLAYDTPDTLGADRLAAAAAGWAQYGRPTGQSVLVIDTGTAVTYDVVHRDGVYMGGAIGAGPALVRDALQKGTAQLPDVPLSLPSTPVGRSTQEALQSGIMWGLVDSVRGMTTRLADTLPDTPHIVLTGGWSELLTTHLEPIEAHAPHLVLEGARLLSLAQN